MQEKSTFSIPEIQPFQFDTSSSGTISKSVNMFRGDVNFFLSLVNLEGRNGLNVKLAALYQSNVKHFVNTWNLDAPTGILGLGWHMPMEHIAVDTQGTGMLADNVYYYVHNDNPNRLYRIENTWKRGTLACTYTHTLNQKIVSKELQQAFFAQALLLSQDAIITPAHEHTTWQLQDATYEVIYQVKEEGDQLSIYDGGWAYELEQYEFWRIRYYQPFERWEITRGNGNTSVFGGHVQQDAQGYNTSLGNSIEWGVKWGNWIGPSILTHDAAGRVQQQYALKWNHAQSYSPWRDVVQFQYQQTQQQVGENGLPYTKACYLQQITDVFGRTVSLVYDAKTWNNTAQEYLDPNKATPNDTPDAYQSKYETQYLKCILVKDTQGTLLFTLQFQYQLHNYSNTTFKSQQSFQGAASQAASFVKRTLIGLTKYMPDGSALPGILMDYHQGREANTGALKHIIYPEGGKITYTYQSKALSTCNRRLSINSPLAGSKPRVWFGADYAVVAWYDERGQLSITVYTWLGRWQAWQPKEKIINTYFDINDLHVQIEEHFFVLYYIYSNRQTTQFWAFHKDNSLMGNWLAHSDNPIIQARDQVTITSGERFFVLNNAYNNTLTRYTWHPLTKVWKQDSVPPITHQGYPDRVAFLTSSVNNVLLVLKYDLLSAPGYKDNQLYFHYLDELGTWQSSNPSIAIEVLKNIAIDTQDKQAIHKLFHWSASASFFAATYVHEDAAYRIYYDLLIFSWHADEVGSYQLHTAYQKTYQLDKSQPSGTLTIPYQAYISPTGLITTGTNLLRFNGQQWLENDNLAPQLPVEDGTLFSLTYGTDFVIKTENAENKIFAAMQVYDPNTSPAKWDSDAIQLYNNPPQEKRLSHYSASAGLDFISFNKQIYARGTSTDWIAATQNPLYIIGEDINTTTMVNQAPAFFAYLVLNGQSVQNTAVIVLKNGQVQQVEPLPENFFHVQKQDGTYETHVEGKQATGYASLLTYLPLDKDFDEAESITLYRYLEGSIQKPVVDFPIAAIEINDGYNCTNYTYGFDQETAACDASGAVVKYYASSMHVHAREENGHTQYYFYNGLPENKVAINESAQVSSVLDGMIRKTLVYDAQARVVFQNTPQWEVKRTINTIDGVQKDLPIHGVYVRAKRQTTQKDGVEHSVHYEYDPSSGLLIKTSTEGYNALGQLENYVTYQTYGYQQDAAFQYSHHMQALIGAQKTLQTAQEDPVVTSQHHATWKRFTHTAAPALDLQLLAAYQTYTLAKKTTALQQPHNDTSNYLPRSDENDTWYRMATVTQRTAHGLVKEREDPTRRVIATLYDKKEELTVAVFSNASLVNQEAFYYGFEPYEDAQGWHIDPANLRSDDVFTGTRSLQIAPHTQVPSLTLQPTDQTQKYLLGCWAKTGKDFTAQAEAGWYIQCNSHEQPIATLKVRISNTQDTWQYFFQVIDLPAIRAQSAPLSETPIQLVFTPFNNNTAPYLIDHVAFSSYVGGFVANVYEAPYYKITAELGPYNQVTRHVYDSFQRSIAQIGPENKVLTTHIPYLSRQNQAHKENNFHPATPNHHIHITPQGVTFYDRFYNGGNWQKHWAAAAPTEWQSEQGYLKHTTNNAGTISLHDPAITENYYAYVQVKPLRQEGIQQHIGLQIGTALAVLWDPATKQWSLKDRLTSQSLTADATTHDQGKSWVIAVTSAAVLFLVDGQVIFSYLAPQPITGRLTLVTSDEVAFSQVMVGSDPIISMSFLDGTGKEQQQHALSGKDYIASATYFDQQGRGVITTKPAQFTADSQYPLLAYRDTLITAFDWTTGIMQGDIAAYYPADQGYPYHRTAHEPSPLGRVLEVGAPGKDFAITAAAPGERHTTKYQYGTNPSDGFPKDMGLPPGSYYQNKVIDPDGMQSLQLVDQQGRTVASGILLEDGTYLTSSHVTQYSNQGHVQYDRLPNYHTPPSGSQKEQWVVKSTYNLLGRKTRFEHPDSGTTTYIYDMRGNLRFSQDEMARQEGKIIYVQYDALDRVLEKGIVTFQWDAAILQDHADHDPSWPANTLTTQWTHRFAYDGDGTDPNQMGQLTQAIRADVAHPATVGGQEVYTYDRFMRLQAKAITVPSYDDANYHFEYAYDNLGSISKLTYPSGLVLAYTRDALGRLHQLSSNKHGVLNTYAYAPTGHITQETRCPGSKNQLIRNYTYNPCDWLTSIQDDVFQQHLDYTQNGYQGASYYSGKIANQCTQFSLPNSGKFNNTLTYAYQYDHAGRLQVAQGTQGSQQPLTASIGLQRPTLYDANGNILQLAQGEHLANYHYEAGTDKVVNTQGNQAQDYRYNADGAIIAAQPRSIKNIAYDLASKLPYRITTDDQAELTFTYGPGGKKVSQISNGQKKLYLHAKSSKPLMEKVYNRGKETTLAYIYGPGGLLGFARDQQLFIVLNDHQGSTRVVMDSQSNVVAAYHYLPFGEVITPIYGDKNVISYLYTGYEWDEKTGLYLANARLYDPQLKRFYATDPAHQFASPYLYAGNDPILFIDPTGNFSTYADLGLNIFSLIVDVLVMVAAAIAAPETGGVSLGLGLALVGGTLGVTSDVLGIAADSMAIEDHHHPGQDRSKTIGNLGIASAAFGLASVAVDIGTAGADLVKTVIKNKEIADTSKEMRFLDSTENIEARVYNRTENTGVASNRTENMELEPIENPGVSKGSVDDPKYPGSSNKALTYGDSGLKTKFINPLVNFAETDLRFPLRGGRRTKRAIGLGVGLTALGASALLQANTWKANLWGPSFPNSDNTNKDDNELPAGMRVTLISDRKICGSCAGVIRQARRNFQ